MEPKWGKLDRELQVIYSNYLSLKVAKDQKGAWIHSALQSNPEKVFVTIQFDGDINDISRLEKSGFHLQSIEKDGIANGYIELVHLAKISHINSIKKIYYGNEMYPTLDTSVLEILARGSTPGTDCVWSVNQTTGIFNGMTGEGVIIGIIDTGIEWRHQNFMKHDVNQTRIISIWDQGLVPSGTENSPDAAFLTAGPSYGVEYTEATINTELSASSTPPAIRHKDCNGHGTHVAGIAAGNGKETHKGKTRFIYTGVAPKARIVVVKYLYLENVPTGVNSLKRFKDAICYINRIAEREGLPVIINCSFGSNIGPHDGLVDDGSDGQQVYLESIFKTATGKVCIFAAGNNSGRRHHAIITIPSGGSIDIPFLLYDPRTVRNDFNQCTVRDNTKSLFLSFWYRNNVAGLSALLKPSGETSFSSPVVAGGPPLINQIFNVNKQYSIFHDVNTADRLGSPSSRNNILITIEPHSNLHGTGIYSVRLAGPVGSVIHVWCQQSNGYGFKIDPAFTSSDVRITDNYTLGQPGDTPSVITVAAYNDIDNRMACFSSKGPLVDYGTGILADKPDICAPGFNILSAKSYQTGPSGDTYSAPCRSDYMPKNGTSMASPHVAGLVALLLQKDRTLSLSRIKSELINAIRSRPISYPDLGVCNLPAPLPSLPEASANEAGAGKPDAKSTWNNI